MRQQVLDAAPPTWEFIAPMKPGLPYWSRTRNFEEWNAYVNKCGYVKALTPTGIKVQDPKTGAQVGMFHREQFQGTIFHDVREHGLEIVTATTLDFTK